MSTLQRITTRNMKRLILLFSILAMSLGAQAYTNVEGFYGETWLDYVDEDGFENFGGGTESNPYQIRSAGALAYLARKVNNGTDFHDIYFVIAANIDLDYAPNGTKLVWVPIGLSQDNCFKGTLTNGKDDNGKPYEITGMTIRADSTGTTKYFGLFGVLQGTVEGLVIKNAEITVETNSEFKVGTLCGFLGSGKVNEAPGTIRRCTVENVTIDVTTSKARNSVGGLIGTVYDFTELSSNLAKTTIRATGPLYAGGAFGFVAADCQIKDCHTVVDMTVENATESEASAGGITGCCNGTYSSKGKTELMACTASGDIEVSGDGTHVVMGGITGHASVCQKLYCCVTSVSLSGGHTMGGLMGFYEDMKELASAGIYQCFCSSFVDAKKATYAGGMFGHVSFRRLYNTSARFSVGVYGYQVFSTFAGTMTKPESADSKYGVIVGYVERDQKPDEFGYFRYDRQMCDLQLNGMGWTGDYNATSPNWGTGAYRLVAAFDSPKPQDGVYAYYQEAWMAELEQQSGINGSFYTANMKVACAPLIITNDYKTYFNAYDVTIDFLVEKFVNQTTGEELATYQLASPTPSCLKLSDNKAKLLDPGEAVIIVNCRGAQRKVHIDITYGEPWDGDMPDNVQLPGSGTAKDPYVIHTAAELCRVAYSNVYNTEGKHFILSNDLFINTHLLTDDEQPCEGSQNWWPYNWRAILHGNGKTIYGLKSAWSVSDFTNDEGAPCGLFRRVSGKVEDLAVVDAFVQASGSETGIAAGIICGELLAGGSIERCVAHGGVTSNGYAGGICGMAESSGTRIADCFAAVHIGWPGSSPENYIGAGIVGATPEEITRCVSTCKVEVAGEGPYGITRDVSRATDCWFDRQMMSQDDASKGSTYTKYMIGGKILSGNSYWYTEQDRYPMLRQFAGTTYGSLLAAPVFFANDRDVDEWAVVDRAGYVSQIFDLPTENIVWRARLGTQHLDVINECGAGTPNGKTTSEPDHLIAETESLASLCTRAKHCIAVDVKTDKAGIRFKDSRAEAACLTAFDADADRLVGLREAYSADKAKFQTFNSHASAVESFTEMRYFAGITNLEEGMLSGLAHLNELELPKVLTTISPNAFLGCTSLKSVTLPHTFTTANGESFFGSGIKNILVNDKNPLCQSIDGALYKTDDRDETKVMLMAYPPGRGETSATLSAPLSTILSKAFYRVPKLDNVYIDNCLPEGEMADLYDDGIVHENDDDLMHIYVNDGSFNSQLFAKYSDKEYSPWYDYIVSQHLDIYYPLTVTSALWATLYIDFDAELPEGLTAYIADVPNEEMNTVELHSIGRIIPRSTPVAIKAEEPGLYPLYQYKGTVPVVNKYDNRFIGSFIGQDGLWGVPVNQETAVEGSTLTLGRNKSGQVGFFKYNGAEIPPYRAYLTRNLVNEEEPPTYLTITIGDDIDGISQPAASLERQGDTAVYDLQGRRVSPQKKGLYIIHGKKVVIR